MKYKSTEWKSGALTRILVKKFPLLKEIASKVKMKKEINDGVISGFNRQSSG